MNEFGERKVIFILNEGEIINEVFLSDVTSTVTCEAFEKSTISMIPTMMQMQNLTVRPEKS